MTLAALASLAAVLGVLAWSWAQAGPEYDTVAVTRGDVEASVVAVGKLQPRRFVDVGAQVSGQIQHLHVQPGDTVKKGQLLVEIDPSVQKATVDAGRAALSGLRAQLAEQQAQHALTLRQAQRQRALDAGGATRTEDVDIAEAALAQAAARVAHIQAQITQNVATVQADEVRLGYTRIYAPMDGTVVNVEAREGQTLNATYQTPAILRIADLSVMTVWTEVSEAEVRKVRAGMPVYFSTLGGDQRRWQAQVRQVLPAPSGEGKSLDSALAPSSNKVVVYMALFDVDNRDGALMPQMTAQVHFVVAAARDVLVVPLAAVRKDKERLLARIRLPDGRIEERELRAGVRNRISVEVQQGVQAGEQIVIAEKPGRRGLPRFQL
ncbi:efflux RND transporter periplasmic adaptor subunit [Herbaspirillum sp. BH-1]|uniref:Macrolide-specific efflux system membrane fusion protein n=1 Tax=Herbaspirillum frisingense TaxID=92645 RepID=A0ABU1P8L0_9BURK|nr:MULTISPECIES: efflux RND transporter periplasmic adaptor subunit [Herbaspirillum]MDR6582249.1 macrolide-specific efflux system membrane fusion protein [Herbaspirillum frisingense]PLY59231.1 efflux RND transporter periplasmic adaptor subunit [Herbaspirillum sp. BH-1]